MTHLSGLLGISVKATLGMDAEIPDGAPENVGRSVTENCSALKFDSNGFEEE